MSQRDELIASLRKFKRLRDNVLYEDLKQLKYHLKQFVKFCETDEYLQKILKPMVENNEISSSEWWNSLHNDWSRHGSSAWKFPETEEDEMALRYELLDDVTEENSFVRHFRSMRASNLNEGKQMFLSIVARPLLEYLSDKLSELANIPSSEIRALQAVPPNRLPGANEVKVFLSHKSVDKPRVQKYYDALSELGFDPWLDTSEMPAGTPVDRGIKQGFVESCAAVFFITENFRDEHFLKDEIDYARVEKRKKRDKFSIITLLFSDDAEVPDLLEHYIYIHVENDLEGFYEVLRALPIESGGVRWKESVVK